MRAVSIVGFKKSGKTTLTALIAEALERRGLRVGVIKFSHHGLDKQNTDTFWLMRPGRIVAGCGPDEAAIFWSRPVAARDLAALMDVDVILAEGGKSCDCWPRILCLKEPGEASLLRAPAGGEGESRVLATVGTAPEASVGPHFVDATPETAEALADLILQDVSEPPHQRGPAGETVSVTLGGGKLALPPSMEERLRQEIMRVLREVKTPAPGEEVIIRL